MQPIVPLQRTAGKATSINLKFLFLENNRVQYGLIEKFGLAFSTFFAKMVTTFQVGTHLFNNTFFDTLTQFRKHMKNNYIFSNAN